MHRSFLLTSLFHLLPRPYIPDLVLSKNPRESREESRVIDTVACFSLARLTDTKTDHRPEDEQRGARQPLGQRLEHRQRTDQRADQRADQRLPQSQQR